MGIDSNIDQFRKLPINQLSKIARSVLYRSKRGLFYHRKPLGKNMAN